MSSGKMRNVLTLRERVEVLKTLEKHPGMKLQHIAELYGYGETQIFMIVKCNYLILSTRESNLPITTKWVIIQNMLGLIKHCTSGIL